MNFTDSEDYISFSDFVSSRYNPSLQRKLQLPLSSICVVLGLVGNLLVIFAVVKSKRLHNAPCLLLANLAVADLLAVVVLIPLGVTSKVLNEGRPRINGGTSWFWCRLEPYIDITLPVSSIFTMVAISIERYYVVLHPLRAKSYVTMGRVKKVIVGIWITSCIMTIPALFLKKTRTLYLKGLGLKVDTYVYCVYAVPNWIVLTFDVYVFLLVFFIPLIIVSYIYIRIGVHLTRTRKGVGNFKDLPVCSEAYRDSSGWSSGSHSKSQTQNVTSADEAVEMEALPSVPNRAEGDSSTPWRHRTSGEDDNIQRVIRVLAVVVALFILTWGPLKTYDLAVYFMNPDVYRNYTNRNILPPLFVQLAAFNSCMNPIIYAFMSKTFRQGFKEVIRGCRCSLPLRNNSG